MWLWPLPRLKGDTRCCSAGPVQGCDLLENYGNLVFVGLLSSKPKLITQLDGRAMDGSIRGSIRYLCRGKTLIKSSYGCRSPTANLQPFRNTRGRPGEPLAGYYYEIPSIGAIRVELRRYSQCAPRKENH
ncbi:zinc finger protein 485 isoform X7 [Physeter macrocephalus]|uniref:Zinc finger protein 485 isoform X7 n=1 Tax=Physeter macrocephalus TaxID=9755 RepID=A0A9W2WCU6_PHYMC|nr:zinc finger protein 485 isoform X7 [Physeter catodon]